ncbi:unnamed protein product [Adineta ricciae]|uniref:Uncharacterized protein n=1 Tax=Adineta ricciae TaxID=249248 RepID=A0A815V6L1_ADIRI|nr:unnamed protein product [Adineta ricciae]
MHFTCSLVTLTVVFGAVNLSHFRGGTIRWQPVDVSAVSSSTTDIIIEQSYSWRRSANWCNDTTILTQGSIGDIAYLRCSTTPSCGGYTNNLLTTVPCTDYSVSVDVSSGRKSSILTLNSSSHLVLQFSGTAWLPLKMGGTSWSISTMINLELRKDNGRLNTPPTSSILPVVAVPINVQRTIVVPMVDDDNDYVRCRWAEKSHNFISFPNNVTIDECGDVCSTVPNATLVGGNNETSCRLTFTGTSSGYYLAAIQIEDFYRNTSITIAPLSTVPVQFLIYVSNNICQPTIIGPYPNGATVQVKRNMSMSSVAIVGQTNCANTTITDFLKIRPTGMTTSAIVRDPNNSSLYSIQLDWIPTLFGSQTFCCAAIDNTLAQSEMYCLTFQVVDSPITAPTATANQSKEPNIGLIVGLLLAGLSLCCLCCWWLCFKWLCPFRGRDPCAWIRRHIFQRDAYLKKQLPKNRSNFVPTSASSLSKMTATSSAYDRGNTISTGKTTRLSNDLAELGRRYANNSLTTLKQPIKHIRTSIELIRKACQKNQQPVEEFVMKQYSSLSNSDSTVHVQRVNSVRKDVQQTYQVAKEESHLTQSCNASSIGMLTDCEDLDDKHQHRQRKHTNQHRVKTVTVTKVSCRKKSAVPSISC